LNEEQKEEKLGQIAIIKEMQKKLNELKNVLEIIKKTERRRKKKSREMKRKRRRK